MAESWRKRWNVAVHIDPLHHFEESDDRVWGCFLIWSCCPFGAGLILPWKRVSEQFKHFGRSAVGAARFYWQSQYVKMDHRQLISAAVLVDIPDPKDVTRGVMYRDIGYLEGLQSPVATICSEAGVD